MCSLATDIITLLGSLFVGALKAVAPVLVFFLVISALGKRQGRRFHEDRRRALRHLRRCWRPIVAVVDELRSSPSTLTLDDLVRW